MNERTVLCCALPLLLNGCSGIQAPMVVNVTSDRATSNTYVNMQQESSKRGENEYLKGCGQEGSICVRQLAPYDDQSLGLYLSTSDVRADGSAKVDMRLPGFALRRGLDVEVGQLWDFVVAGTPYRLTVVNVFFGYHEGKLDPGYVKYTLSTRLGYSRD